MNVNIWAKKGVVSITIVNSASPNALPIVTINIKDPQILYDESTGKITIIEN